MKAGLPRGLVVASLVAIMAVACSGKSKVPFTAKTPEELKQLSEVTDSIVLLANNEREVESAFTRDAAVQRGVAAVAAARGQFRMHSDAVVSPKNVDAAACIGASELSLTGLPIVIEKLRDAVHRQDAAEAEGFQSLLAAQVNGSVQCVTLSSLHLIGQVENRDALQHGAVLMSESYAAAMLLSAASGVSIAPLLERQIAEYETISEKLGANHQLPMIVDALPKLKAALMPLQKTAGSPQ